LVTWQIGRAPRSPWRVAVRCQWGRPSVIASPARLADGTPFPTLFWLTCPFLLEAVSALESAGFISDWNERAGADPRLIVRLGEADIELRERRARESGGHDDCASVGVAGQRNPERLKCLHAHVALTLAGIPDPAGDETLALVGGCCADDACAPAAADSSAELLRSNTQRAEG
jgi:hypothetical protein